MLITRIPSSVYRVDGESFTTIIFLKESLMRSRELDSCCIFIPIFSIVLYSINKAQSTDRLRIYICLPLIFPNLKWSLKKSAFIMTNSGTNTTGVLEIG